MVTSEGSSQHGTSREHRGRRTSGEHQGCRTSGEHRGCRTSGEHQGCRTSREHQGCRTSGEHQGRRTSGEHLGRRTSEVTGVTFYVEDSRRGIVENRSILVGSLGVRQRMNCLCTFVENLLLPRAMSLTVL